MARQRVPRTEAGGRWTAARKRSFITSQLRNGFQKWPPKFDVLRNSSIDKSHFRCEGYKKRWHKAKKTIDRKNNRFVDHIDPVVPIEGFNSWDDYIARMFVEEEGLQVLCKECHDKKTKDENERRKKHG